MFYTSYQARVVGVLLFSLFLFSGVMKVNAYAFTETLDIGSRGEQVTTAQKVLRALGFFSHPELTNYFGPATKAAVTAFQEAEGLAAVGTVGPLTRAALTRASEAIGAALDQAGDRGDSPIAPTPAGFSVGQNIKLTYNANVRSSEGITSTNLLVTRLRGVTGKIIAGPTVASGYTWVKVDFATGIDGWVVVNAMATE